jgi:tRNA-(ms[2]io[6]A)-hydroxylase
LSDRHPSRDRELPLLSATAPGWARLATENLGLFLADHAFCEQQAALSALNLVAHYPEDEELVDRMTALAAEEVLHFRKVVGLLRKRGLRPARRRRNPYVQTLRAHLSGVQEPWLKTGRLLVGALIEARSCERFTRLLERLPDTEGEVRKLLEALAPAERRHWETFHDLAARAADEERFRACWREWLAWEDAANADGGVSPTVHG